MVLRHKSSPILHAALLAFTVCTSNGRADTIAGPIPIAEDEPTYFRATGTLVSEDTSNPPDGISGANLELNGTNWKFVVTHEVVDWEFTINGNDKEGADNAQLIIKDTSIHKTNNPPPHPGDNANNGLPELASAKKKIEFGKSKIFAKSKRDPHPGIGHVDKYSLKQTAFALQAANNQITGPAEIVAAHAESGDVKDLHKDHVTLCADGAGGSAVFYDAVSGLLSFNIGGVSLLDDNGGLLGGIDPDYAGDPVLAAQIVADDIEFLGTEPDGRFRFGGGTVTIIDPDDQFTFAGTFNEFFIDDTTAAVILTSFAILEEVGITDVGDEADGPSPFLQDFVDVNLLGHGTPNAVWAEEVLAFSFVTSVDLAVLTSGFTQSVSDIPATYCISAGRPAGDPIPLASAWGMLTLTLLILTVGTIVFARTRRKLAVG